MLDIIPLRVNRSTLVYQNNKGMYNNFCKKKAAVLLCTDIAARELDFPKMPLTGSIQLEVGDILYPRSRNKTLGSV